MKHFWQIGVVFVIACILWTSCLYGAGLPWILLIGALWFWATSRMFKQFSGGVRPFTLFFGSSMASIKLCAFIIAGTPHSGATDMDSRLLWLAFLAAVFFLCLIYCVASELWVMLFCRTASRKD